MVTLVKQVAGEWKKWEGPFDNPNISRGKVDQLIESGLWTEADLAPFGLRVAVPFVPPAGKLITGNPTYTEVGPNIIETYAVTDPPPPTPEEIRIAAYGAEPDVVALLSQLDTSTANQVNTWVNTNVTNLTQARDVLKTLIKVVALTRRGM